MAGLLDFLNSPEAQLGIGLLAYSGDMGRPMGFGERIAGGMGYAQKQQESRQDRELKAKLSKSQLAENESQAELRQAQVADLQRKQAMIGGLLGYEPGSGGAQSASAPLQAGAAGGGSPEMGGMAPAAAPQQGGSLAQLSAQYRIPLQALQYDLAFNGGRGIADMVSKRGTPDMQVANGFAYDKNTLAGGFLPQINTSQDGKSTTTLPDPRTGLPHVMPTPGAVQAFGAFQDAQNRSGAAYAPGRPVLGGDGRQYGQSQLQEIGGGPPRAATPGQAFTGAGYAGGSAANAAGDQRFIMERELSAAQQRLQQAQASGNGQAAALATQDVAGLQREIQRLPGAASAPAGSAAGALDFSPGEKATQEAQRTRQVEQAKADVTPTDQKLSAFTTAQDALGLIDRALAHPGRATATGLSGTLDPRNYVPGTQAKDFGVMLDQIKGGTFLQAFQSLKGGGAITEVEGKKAEQAIARLERAQSDGEFESALKDYRTVLNRGMERAREKAGVPATTAEQPQDAARPVARLKTPPTDADLRNTALKHKMTVEEVRKQLGM